METFADQAVIAIENVRLFKELAARNRDLTEALERQTATAEILSVISSSPTGVQPTFDAIAKAGPNSLPEVRRTPRWEDLGQESARRGLDVHVHDPGASWRMSSSSLSKTIPRT
jgi:hypothetical protein